MSQQYSINSERVAAAVNQIDVHISDIDTRIKKFISLLTEKNAQTHNKFQLIKTLQDRVEDAANNIKNVVNACESIKDSVRAYTSLAEEANDDSEFRV